MIRDTAFRPAVMRGRVVWDGGAGGTDHPFGLVHALSMGRTRNLSVRVAVSGQETGGL
jgi:hypothetical protein